MTDEKHVPMPCGECGENPDWTHRGWVCPTKGCKGAKLPDYVRDAAEWDALWMEPDPLGPIQVSPFEVSSKHLGAAPPVTVQFRDAESGNRNRVDVVIKQGDQVLAIDRDVSSLPCVDCDQIAGHTMDGEPVSCKEWRDCDLMGAWKVPPKRTAEDTPTGEFESPCPRKDEPHEYRDDCDCGWCRQARRLVMRAPFPGSGVADQMADESYRERRHRELLAELRNLNAAVKHIADRPTVMVLPPKGDWTSSDMEKLTRVFRRAWYPRDDDNLAAAIRKYLHEGVGPGVLVDALDEYEKDGGEG